MKKLLLVLAAMSALSFSNVRVIGKSGINYGLDSVPVAVEVTKSFKTNHNGFYTRYGFGGEAGAHIALKTPENTKAFLGFVGPVANAEIGKEFGELDVYGGLKARLPIYVAHISGTQGNSSASATGVSVRVSGAVYAGVKYNGVTAEVSTSYPEAVTLGLGYEF